MTSSMRSQSRTSGFNLRDFTFCRNIAMIRFIQVGDFTETKYVNNGHGNYRYNEKRNAR